MDIDFILNKMLLDVDLATLKLETSSIESIDK